MIRAPSFWWRPGRTPLAAALAPLAWCWGAIAARRMRRRGWRSPVPVVCVGNFVVGGAGKTPVAIAIAELLIQRGETPFFLSRGHGGDCGKAPVLVDAARHGAAHVGDEPLLLSRVAPTIVCADRPAGARLAVANGASVIVMDDGLQNPSLEKTLAIAVVDAAVGIGNGLCMPAGPMRAPLDAQWRAIDAVIALGEGGPGDAITALAKARGMPVLSARLLPHPDAAARLRGKKVLAFAGIGRPEKFFATLADIGADIAARRPFPDHHAFSAGELEDLAAEAKRLGAVLATTEKDAIRLPRGFDVEILPVAAQFQDETALAALFARATI